MNETSAFPDPSPDHLPVEEAEVQTSKAIVDELLREQELASAVARELPLRQSTHESHLYELKNGSLGIFKPADGEKSVVASNIPPGTMYGRERGAYLVDRAFKLGVVPVTVIREIDGRVGSMQAFVPDAQDLRRMELPLTPELKNKLYKIWILDIGIRNADRFTDGILVEGASKGLPRSGDVKLFATDNGSSFSKAIPGVGHDFYDHPAPPEVIEAFREFTQDTTQQQALLNELSPLLPEEEAQACIARLRLMGELLADHGMISRQDQEITFFPGRDPEKTPDLYW